MTGKFRSHHNKIVIVTFVAWVFVATFCGLDTDDQLIGFFVTLAVIMFAEYKFLEKGRFTADDDKIIFQVGFIRYKYSYAQIFSTETKTAFSNDRFIKYFCVDFVINLNNGKTVTFRDWNVHAEAFSDIESYKYGLESHQFTKLSNYINQRAGK